MIRQATFPLLFALSPALRPEPAEVLERHIRRSLLRREPVVAGTVAAPYEPAGSSESPLRLLAAAEGLEIGITTASPRIGRELDLLVELDRRHSVTVRMVVSMPVRPGTVARLGAVRSLAAEGITTRLHVTLAAGAREADLRALLAEAREAGVYDIETDVEIEAGPQSRRSLLTAFRSLRLEHGFPRDVPGRG
jgi:DNA repair photolyase